MSRRGRRFAAVILPLALALVGVLQAAPAAAAPAPSVCTNEWRGTLVDDWREAKNWSAAHVPIASDALCIAGESPGLGLPAGVTAMVAGVYAGSKTLTIDGSLTVTGPLTSFGVVQGGGRLILASGSEAELSNTLTTAQATVDAGARLNFPRGVTMTTHVTSALTVRGTLSAQNWVRFTGRVDLTGATLTAPDTRLFFSGALVRPSGVPANHDISTTSELVTTGPFEVAAGGNLDMSGTMSATGQIRIASGGKARLVGDISGTGSLLFDSGATAIVSGRHAIGVTNNGTLTTADNWWVGPDGQGRMTNSGVMSLSGLTNNHFVSASITNTSTGTVTTEAHPYYAVYLNAMVNRGTLDVRGPTRFSFELDNTGGKLKLTLPAGAAQMTGSMLTLGHSPLTIGGALDVRLAEGASFIADDSVRLVSYSATPAGSFSPITLADPDWRTTQDRDGVTMTSAAPKPPAHVVATSGYTEASATWAAPSTPPTGYVMSTVPASTTRTVGAGTTSTTMTGLTNGRSYQVIVAATYADGRTSTGRASNSVTVGRVIAPAPVPSDDCGFAFDTSWGDARGGVALGQA